MPVTTDAASWGGVQITVLADNTADLPFVSEHGFAAVIDVCGEHTHRILFDTGRGALFANAPAAGVDLNLCEALVLSHGHYDHTDALPEFMARYPRARIHASTGIFRHHYSKRTGTCRFIGLSPESRIAILAPESTYVPFSGNTSICAGRVSLADNIPRNHPLETPSPLLFEDEACTVSDTVPDELVLWTDTPDGLVILTGCCHAGFMNTVNFVKSFVPDRPVALVAGGFHLAGVAAERIEATAAFIREQGIRRVAAFHCTGDDETRRLAELTGGIVEAGHCGTVLTVGCAV